MLDGILRSSAEAVAKFRIYDLLFYRDTINQISFSNCRERGEEGFCLSPVFRGEYHCIL